VTLRSELREAIARRVLPELRGRGFQGPDKISGNATIHAFVRLSASGSEHLSIQFDKYQRPRFVLNVWVEPPEGIRTFIERGGAHLQGRIAPGNRFSTRGWFRGDRPWWQRLVNRNSTRTEAAIDEVLARLDAIDDWFSSPRDTKTVSTFAIRSRDLGKMFSP
jgi:hypothetical protein